MGGRGQGKGRGGGVLEVSHSRCGKVFLKAHTLSHTYGTGPIRSKMNSNNMQQSQQGQRVGDCKVTGGRLQLFSEWMLLTVAAPYPLDLLLLGGRAENVS